MTKIAQEVIWLADITGSLERTKKYLPEHYVTLWGERDAGSKWGFPLTIDHVNSGNWKLIQGGPVRIYRKFTEHRFTLGIQPLSMTDMAAIRVQEGSHGPELVMDTGSKDLPVTSVMTLIIGPEEDCGDIVFTVHPGDATPPHGCKTAERLQEKLDKDELNPDTSVKFV